MRYRLLLSICLALTFASLSPVHAQNAPRTRESLAPVNVGATGIAIKRPVFAGACKACPWGVLAFVTQEALKPYGYDVVPCWVCWSSFGPREMADKTKPVLPPGAENEPTVSYIEPPPDAVPDISATSEPNLINAWSGDGPFAPDKKKRQNYRVIAVVHQPNFLMLAASKKSGITDLSQVKDRKGPTWIAATNRDIVIEQIMAYYGISEADLKAKGGGFVAAGRHARTAHVVRGEPAQRSQFLRYSGAAAGNAREERRLSARHRADCAAAWRGTANSDRDAFGACDLRARRCP